MRGDAGVQRAIEAAGGARELAKALGISRLAVYQWYKVPRQRVRDIEDQFGVPRHILRPDCFSAEGKSNG